jgi:beta-lactam-binding protein with PASTA domain
MASHVAPAVPRLLALMLVALAATAAAAFATQREHAAPVLSAASAPAGPAVLIVPDVRSQAYVFAKGMLEESGFAWTVSGPVHGYSANPVVSQEPAPGTRVVDTGRPTIVLHLSKSGSQAEHGTPENGSPYPGTAIRALAETAAE